MTFYEKMCRKQEKVELEDAVLVGIEVSAN